MGAPKAGRSKLTIKTSEKGVIRTGLVGSDEVKEMVLSHGGLLTPREIALKIGMPPRRVRFMLSTWEKNRQIFLLRFNGRIYIPQYALIFTDESFEANPALFRVIESLTALMGSWQIAFWFMCGSNFLGGQTPEDYFNNVPERVIAAAKFEVDSKWHG